MMFLSIGVGYLLFGFLSLLALVESRSKSLLVTRSSNLSALSLFADP